MNLATEVQDTIAVDVAFYDEAEKQKLLTYPTARQMERLVESGIQVPTAEFLTNYLFHRKRLGIPAYGNLSALKNRTNEALYAIGECLDFDGQSLCTPRGTVHQLNEISEHVGESIGLSVIGHIHGLHEADWDVITEQRGRGAAPTFDFQKASDDQQVIQLETKGSSVQDNRIITDAVSHHKGNIAEKKRKLGALANEDRDPYPASLRYGTITALDPRRDGNVRCWLVDPPPDLDPSAANRFRLLHRMRFLRGWISFLAYRSPLAAALATRVVDLEDLQDPFQLDGIPLLHGSGTPFDLTPYTPTDIHSRFFATKSKVADGPAGGMVIQLSPQELFFFGIRQDLVLLAAEQNFSEITTFGFPSVSITKTVECVISQGRFNLMTMPESLKVEKRKGYVSFRQPGQLHYSPGGLVFGVLPIPPK